MSIRDNYLEILKRKDAAAKRSGRSPEDVILMAVTKKHEPAELKEAIDAGATDFGENKVQELLSNMMKSIRRGGISLDIYRLTRLGR